MPIRFKCRHCKKSLAVKEQLAGRKAICPGCRKPIIIPRPKPTAAQVEELAAAMLGDGEAKKPEVKTQEAAPIKFNCEFCDEAVQVAASNAGTKMPCPECKRIIRVPVPQEDKPKDWRDVAKKGPIGAKVNQPEAIENAWGTEQVKGATRQALEEADALPVTAASSKLNLSLWLKRGFFGTMTIGFLYLAVTGIMRSRAGKMEKSSVDEAVKLSAELNGDWAAEIHRAAGELGCAKREPVVQARKHFHIALASLQRSARAGIKEGQVGPIDIDLFLIDLALAQVELGGNDDEILSKVRLPWAEVQRDLSQTLASISRQEARELALRLVGARIAEKKQMALAIGLAGSSPPQQVGLNVAYRAYLEKAKDDKDKEVSQNALKALKALDAEPQENQALAFPKGEGAISRDARWAHVEGLARQGKYKDALDLACDRRLKNDAKMIDEEALACLSACVCAAELALANKNPTDAAPFVQKALELIQERQQRQLEVDKWWAFATVRAGIEADVAEVQELVKTLEPAFQAQIRLANFRRKLGKSSAPLPSVDDRAAIEQPERELLSWSTAWEALARHNARLGQSRDQVLALVRESEDERVRAFVLVGFALGQHERK